MPPMLQVLKQDFKAFSLAAANGRFALAVVFANRIVSNVFFSEDKRPALLGFILRHAAIGNLKAEQQGGAAQKDISAATLDLISSCNDALPTAGSVNCLKLWKAYYAYIAAVRKSMLSEEELSAYTDDTAVTGAALDLLYSDFLLTPEMAEPGTYIPQGCLNEVTRLATCLGISERDLPLMAIIIASTWLYEYTSRHYDNDEEVESDLVVRTKERFKNLLEPTRKLLDRKSFPTLESIETPATEILISFLLEWRKDFIRYLEVNRGEESKVPIPISKETREKISDSIKGALQRDLFGKKFKE